MHISIFTFMTRELIEQTRTLFPLSDKREDTAIYGCSVGGYGAYYCGLNRPDVYGHVGAQSGMLDMKWAIEARPFMTIKHQRQFGDNLDISGKSMTCSMWRQSWIEKRQRAEKKFRGCFRAGVKRITWLYPMRTCMPI